MDNITTKNRRLNTQGTTVLLGVTVILVLMLYAVVSYPASVSQAGVLNFLVSVGALLAYAGAALWVRQNSSDSVQIALAKGARIGMFLGIIAVVNLALEHFVASSSELSAVRGVSMWGLMFLSFGAAGSATYQKVGSIGLAALSSIWSGVVSAVWMLIFGFSIALLFMPHMQQILAPAYVQSGMTDSQAFVIRNTLDASASHLLLIPVMATVFGIVGGFASSLLRSIRQRIAMSLGVLEFLLLAGGLASLYIASSLDRPARPPYVMTGLLAMGIALACGHPILMAIRRPTSTA
jgi:hypothetical protein